MLGFLVGILGFSNLRLRFSNHAHGLRPTFSLGTQAQRFRAHRQPQLVN